MAGFVAENVLVERLKIFYWNEIDNTKPGDLMIEFRRKDEYDSGKISNVINIPGNEIRNRVGEIDKDKTLYIYCEAGLRGYLAQRILSQNGFNKVFNLSGGYRTCKVATQE